MNNPKTIFYTTEGDIRGDCGHKHRSFRTAQQCLDKDRAGCKKQGGYSDRNVIRVNPLFDTRDMAFPMNRTVSCQACNAPDAQCAVTIDGFWQGSPLTTMICSDCETELAGQRTKLAFYDLPSDPRPLGLNPECDHCGIDVEEDEYCGTDTDFLCPDCFGKTLSTGHWVCVDSIWTQKTEEKSVQKSKLPTSLIHEPQQRGDR